MNLCKRLNNLSPTYVFSLRHLHDFFLRHLHDFFLRHLHDFILRHLQDFILRHLHDFILRHLNVRLHSMPLARLQLAQKEFVQVAQKKLQFRDRFLPFIYMHYRPNNLNVKVSRERSCLRDKIYCCYQPFNDMNYRQGIMKSLQQTYYIIDQFQYSFWLNNNMKLASRNY